MNEKKSYLGYRPKTNNITKLKQYIAGTSQARETMPNPKPVKLNKRNGK
jgi:hypothetical protein